MQTFRIRESRVLAVLADVLVFVEFLSRLDEHRATFSARRLHTTLRLSWGRASARRARRARRCSGVSRRRAPRRRASRSRPRGRWISSRRRGARSRTSHRTSPAPRCSSTTAPRKPHTRLRCELPARTRGDERARAARRELRSLDDERDTDERRRTRRLRTWNSIRRPSSSFARRDVARSPTSPAPSPPRVGSAP